MAEFTFLSLSEVLEIHQDQVVRYGGSLGVRDLELLKSALGMPAATFGGEYLHTDIYEMAAPTSYIVKNHPFIDGNKRVGAVATLVFLVLNGYDFTVPQGNSPISFSRWLKRIGQGRCCGVHSKMAKKRKTGMQLIVPPPIQIYCIDRRNTHCRFFRSPKQDQ
jgi:death-on-curing protein